MTAQDYDFPQDQNMPEQEKPRCPNFSGSWTGGWSCNVIHGGVSHADLRFCEDDFQSCPAYKGEAVLDDRTCGEIESAFSEACTQVRQSIDEMKRQIGDIARRSGMESINNLCSVSDSLTLSGGSFSGAFSSRTVLTCEEAPALRLESDLNSMMNSMCNTTSYAAGPSSSPTVSVSDFERIAEAISRCESRTSGAFRNMSIGGAEGRFGDIISSAGEDISGKLRYGLLGLESDVRAAEARYVSALSSAEESAAGFGYGILDNPSVEWKFNDD